VRREGGVSDDIAMANRRSPAQLRRSRIMKRFRIYLIAIIAVAIAAPLMAQEDEQPPPMVAQNFFVTVDVGQIVAFEGAAKKHFEWHAAQHDTWYWHTWQIVSGEHFGQYIVRSGNHTWADFDEHAAFDQKDTADSLENAARYVKDLSSNIVVAAPEITKWPDDYGMPAMVDVTVIQVNDEYGRAFYDTMEKIHKAIVEKDIPWTYAWSWVASGWEGPGQTWVLVFPYKSWADYGASFELSFWKMIDEVYGDYGTDMIRKTMYKAVDHQENFMAAYRADLSYNPPE
jgi:hypothetical protein